jgi:uncharacterized protein YdhG (YjbR/CyaY superfamily)
MRAKTAVKPTTIDEYLAGVSSDKRAALQRLRKIIKSAAPGMEECISYRMPAFRFEGKVLVWMGAAANHCSFYPGGIVQTFEGDLASYQTSKGTIRFQSDDPLPAALVRKIVKARIAQNAAGGRRASRSTGRSRASRRR